MPQYRQGHILLHPVTILPNFRPPVVIGDTFGTSGQVRQGEVVLATGETGREHIFRSEKVSIFQSEGSIYIEVRGIDPIALEHPEHEDIEIEPGVYRLVEQREASFDDHAAPRRSFD